MRLAVLDACILFQGKLTNLLLNLGEQGAFDPVWSDEISAEWMRNLAASYEIPWEKVLYRYKEMERFFPVANRTPPPRLVKEIEAMCKTAGQLKDAHVIATAIVAEATVIVTDDIADFPQDLLDRYGLRKVRPDDFCVELYQSERAAFLTGVRAHRASLVKSKYAPDEYMTFVARFLPKTSAVFAEHLEEI